jgi:photosystem II stability/assembly factor-like uncharacterized protein
MPNQPQPPKWEQDDFASLEYEVAFKAEQRQRDAAARAPRQIEWPVVPLDTNAQITASPVLSPEVLGQIADKSGFAALPGFKADDAYVKDTEPKAPKQSLAFVRSVMLFANAAFTPGLLVLRIPDESIVGTDPRTLRVFRWDGDAVAYTLVHGSGVRHGFVCARVFQPGHYIVSGAPSDPVLAALCRSVAELDPILGLLEAGKAQSVRKNLAKTFLDATAGMARNDDLRDALSRGLTLRRLPSPMPDTATTNQPTPADYIASAAVSRQVSVAQRSGFFGTSAWESLGPSNVSGRITQLAVCPDTTTRIYASCDGGGIYVREEWRPRGASVVVSPEEESAAEWRCLTDDTNYTNIISIAAHPNRPAQVWAGVAQPGPLIRSDDYGRTWREPTSEPLGWIRPIALHPSDADTALIASSTGVRFTSNGGRSFDPPVLTGDALTVVRDPLEPRIVYTGIRSVGVHKSADGGQSWRLILAWSSATAPTSTMIQIGVGRLGTDSTRTVIAKLGEEVFVHRQGGNDGEGWVSRGAIGYGPEGPHNIRDGYGDQCHVAAVDPFDNDHFLAGAQDLWLSRNGGQDWERVAGYNGVAHPDQQQVVFDPRQRGRVYLANDGGVYLSRNGGATWEDCNPGLVTTSAHRIAVSGSEAVAGIYHQGIVATTELGEDWTNYGGGAWEFTSEYGDPKRPGRFYIFGNALAAWRNPNIWNFNFGGREDLRFPAYTIAVAQRPGLEATLAVDSSTNTIRRTLNGNLDEPIWTTEELSVPLASGETIVSLTTPEPLPGGPVPPSLPGWAFAASSTGRIFFKDDIASGRPWSLRGSWDAGAGDPSERGRASAAVLQLAVNSIHSDRLYLITSDKFARSIDGGQHWTVANGSSTYRLPTDLHALCAHPTDGTTVYVASAAHGVFVSHDEGATWRSFKDNLPIVSVEWLEARNGFLYASTYGKGLWRRRIV